MTARTISPLWLGLIAMFTGACTGARPDHIPTTPPSSAATSGEAEANAKQVADGSTDRSSRVILDEPTEVYGPENTEIRLRLGNGGAGPTGVLRALAEDYLAATGQAFGIAWHQTITPLTLENLRHRRIDVSLTYEPELEAQAVKDGWASHLTRVFNDHFIIVGPRQNPAALPKSAQADPLLAFRTVSGAAAKEQAGFLSRHDMSGTNVKERSLWNAVGAAPWEDLPAWYVTHQVFPAPALIEADKKALYHITDRGTYLSTKTELSNTVVYAQGGELLLNPCSAMLQAEPSELAVDFMRYLASPRAQELLAHFGADRFDGHALFSPAQQPDFEHPLTD